MLGMLFAHILDCKVIHYQAESNGAGGVKEETVGVSILDVAMAGQVFDQLIIGKATGLGQTIHAFANLHIHRTIVGESIEFVLCQ